MGTLYAIYVIAKTITVESKLYGATIDIGKKNTQHLLLVSKRTHIIHLFLTLHHFHSFTLNCNETAKKG